MLDGMNAGKLAGLTFDEINKQHPDECAARKRDKLLYRWPGLGGEGYVDLIVRLRPLIVELERTTDCLVMITHRPVVRVLLTYFLGIQRDDLGEVHMPKETLYCVDVVSYISSSFCCDGFVCIRPLKSPKCLRIRSLTVQS